MGIRLPPIKGMKLTKPSAAWLPDMEMPPHARAGPIGRGPLRRLSPVFDDFSRSEARRTGLTDDERAG